MKFQFKNLGPLTEAEIELGDLTIICGDNNTGKTYASYAIYGFLETWDNNIDFELSENKIEDLLEKGSIKIDLSEFESKIPQIFEAFSKKYVRYLPKIFSASEDYFSQSSVHVLDTQHQLGYEKIDFQSSAQTSKSHEVLKACKDKHSTLLEITLLSENKEATPPSFVIKSYINRNLGRILLGDYFAEPFSITSERSGISLFHRELNFKRSALVEHLQKLDKNKSLEIRDLFEMMEESVSRYTRPIHDEIDFVRDIIDLHSKKKSPLLTEHPELLKSLNNIINGEYLLADNQLLFSFKKQRKKQKIPLYLGASTVKSLLSLNFYLKHLAAPGQILFIDEPELNLHPANQRRIARLLVRLIKAGIKVFITTHSDYIIKELNNLIILSNNFESKKKIMKKYKYTEEDVLEPSRVKAYIAEHNTLAPAPIDRLGIEISSFDREIREMNKMFDEMTVTMDYAYDN